MEDNKKNILKKAEEEAVFREIFSKKENSVKYNNKRATDMDHN